tara:strand:+ start:202 stop:681 length:480 start_codon:yes stop_codon:yes gene_type:complete
LFLFLKTINYEYMDDIFFKILKNGTGLYNLKKATTGSAGFDLVAAISKEEILLPQETILIPCGFSLEMPQNFEAQVRPRSGIALKNSVTVLNTPGTIDSDYRGEICVILINHGKDSFKIERGMRVAQIIFAKLDDINLKEVSEIKESDRGDGGFGSTGV